MSHYDTLGLQADATAEEIKTAFRRAAKQAHPDREGGSTERMQAVNRANEVLSDPERRARYDATGSDERSSLQAQAFDALMQGFERALQDSGDVVRAAKKHMQGLRQSIEQQQESLRSRSGKTKVKKGENLVQALIDRKLASLAQQHAQAVEALQIHAMASEMLDNYEGEPEPAAAQRSPSAIDALLYAMQGAQQNAGFRGWTGQ